MNLHRAIILNGLQELSNASDPGRNPRLIFEANGNEHWFQCTPTRITLDWPFSSPPSENALLKSCFGAGLRVDEWEVDSYATFFPLNPDVDSLVVGIDRAFQDLYGLGTDYGLTYRLEEV